MTNVKSMKMLKSGVLKTIGTYKNKTKEKYLKTFARIESQVGQDPVRLVLPFKDQASADIVRTQLNDLSQKIHKTIQPVFVSQKIKLREAKPPLVNQQSLVYQFKCDLCDAGYVGFT